MIIDRSVEDRYEKLKRIIRDLKRVLVTYSGGVDSTFLLKVAIDELGSENVLALTGISPTYPDTEREEAQKLADSMGIHLVAVNSSEMDDPAFRTNSRDRCYYCKGHLFKLAWTVAAENGFPYVLEGSNVDDLKDFRPGRKACAEENVKSPLLEAGLTKEDIRGLSKRLGLSTHDKPAQACLSSRIPYGTPISVPVLRQIENSEAYLKRLGLGQVRVRCHGDMARIEVDEAGFGIVTKHRKDITGALKGFGFTYVSLDLAGYRTGSMNESP